MLKSTYVFALMFGMLLIGCASKEEAVVLPVYTAPKAYCKLEKIASGGDQLDGKYLTLAINPDVGWRSGPDKDAVASALINGIKSGLTETNFISIYPIYDIAAVTLNMDVSSYAYEQPDPDTLRASMSVAFTVMKGVTEYLNQTYSAEAYRRAGDSRSLPPRDTVINELAREVTQRFVADISPLRTHQIRVFKPLPEPLQAVYIYAKQGNYESAINAMEGYEGEKDAGFYYNLAVLYEAAASRSERMDDFADADYYYEKSIAKGGGNDEKIVKAKARFDDFYRIFKLTQSQRERNRKLDRELDDMYGQRE